MQETPSQEYLNSIFEYRDGDLYWKNPTSNKIKIGSKAGSLANGESHKRVRLNRKNYLLHRIIFAMHHGWMPSQVDHIDTNSLNNRIENLRPASHGQNIQNQPIRKSNTSGIKNVWWHKSLEKWVVAITANSMRKHIGYFEDIELAELVAIEARNKYHKGFANHG